MVDAEDRRSQDRTDQAALMGAALAAVIATVIQPGLYSLYGSFTGAVLACLVLTYYHRVPMSTPVKTVLRALAFSGVFALAATLFLAYWIQEIGFHNNWWFGVCSDRISQGAYSDEIAFYQQHRCVADRVTDYFMPYAWLGITLIAVIVHERLWLGRRSDLANLWRETRQARA